MALRVYIETSMVSYLTAWPSRDIVVAAHQSISHDWWKRRREEFDLCTSLLVLDEAGRGDPDAAKERLAVLEKLPLIEVTEKAQELATDMVEVGLLPKTAFVDALHIATATVHGIDYLLTWNCTHIANAEILPRIATICANREFALPYICTPEELLGGVQ